MSEEIRLPTVLPAATRENIGGVSCEPRTFQRKISPLLSRTPRRDKAKAQDLSDDGRLAAREVDDMKCEVCGKNFKPKNITQRYCSAKCRCRAVKARKRERLKNGTAYEPPVRTCKICGKTFTANQPNTLCCSEKCRKKYNLLKASEYYYKKHMAEELPPPVCRHCGKEFKPTRAAQVFCSRECYDEYRKPKPKPPKPLQSARASRLNERARQAKECNMDYGTYTAHLAMGKTYEELKAQAPTRQVTVHQHTSHREK